ncbi:MAG: YceI family protein [Bryobacteraceae bacterium]|nr:YceI family protein [Bryobacteraceae bacterium]
MPKTLIAVLATMASAMGETQSFQLAPSASTPLRLEVEKTGLLSGKKHIFEVQKFSGTLVYEAANAASARIELLIDAASLALKDDWLKAGDTRKVQEYAYGKEMLDVARHPQIRFVSTGVTGALPSLVVKGDLTIRGVTRPVEIAVRQAAADTYEVNSVIRLTDFKLKPPSALLGAIGTKNEMRLQGQVSAVPSR